MGYLQTARGKRGIGISEFIETLRAERRGMLTSARADDGDDDEDTRPEPKKPIVAKPKKKKAKKSKAKKNAAGLGSSPPLGLAPGESFQHGSQQFHLASMGFSSQAEADKAAMAARRIRAQVQSGPRTPMERHLDAAGIPWKSDATSQETLLRAIKSSARSGKMRPEHPGFTSRHTINSRGPFDGGSGAAA